MSNDITNVWQSFEKMSWTPPRPFSSTDSLRVVRWLSIALYFSPRKYRLRSLRGASSAAKTDRRLDCMRNRLGNNSRTVP